jgi:hypothetical protein
LNGTAGFGRFLLALTHIRSLFGVTPMIRPK